MGADTAETCFKHLETFRKGQEMLRNLLTAAELDKVKTVGLETGAQSFAIFGIETLVLEFDAIDLNAHHKRRGDAFADGFGDFEDQAGAVLEIATVLVGTFVGGG